MPASNGFVFKSAGTTHPGRVRTVNQDAFVDLPEQRVWAVADGVGGHQRGEAASQAVVNAIAEIAKETPANAHVESIRQRIIEVNHELIQGAHQLGPDALIASTVAVMVADTNSCICLWAGDSRVYGFRQGRLSRLTRDHSHVEQLVDLGVISAQEALHHPDANIILRAVGRSEHLELDAVVYDLYDGDKFLLCTDGITKELDDDEIANVLAQGDCHDNCQQMLNLALSRNCADNIALIVIDVRQPDEGDTTLRRMRPY